MAGEGAPSSPDQNGVVPVPRDESRIVKIPESQWTPQMHKKAAEVAGNIVIGPNGPENKTQFVHPGQIGQENVPVKSDGSEYDHLLDPNAPNPSGSIEDAAVHPNLPPARTTDRPGYWTPPTEDQINRAAEAAGQYDLGKQEKYYPPGR